MGLVAAAAALPFLVASTDRNDAETLLSTFYTETSNNLVGLSLLATPCVYCIVQGNYLQSHVTLFLLSSSKILIFCYSFQRLFNYNFQNES